MSLKNLNAIKIPKIYKKKLVNQKIFRLFNTFDKEFNLRSNFIVAVSGGPDSLALAFLTKIYSIKYRLNCKYFIIDHKLRKESTLEARTVQKKLKDFNIKLEILTWKGKKPIRNIQAIARKKRYELLFSKCKSLKIKNLILGHHLDDMYENFFIRMIRGSGLKGLVSFEKKAEVNNVNLIRPLIKFNKEDLVFISKYVFNFFIKDPSNENLEFKRIQIRKILKEFQNHGFDKDKFFLTLKNLRASNRAILFYVEQNKNLNSFYKKDKNELIISINFFNQPYEIVFRSFTDLIKLVGGKYNAVRGKKIDHILKKIKDNSLNKATLGGCVIKKLNQTLIITKEY
tara:strand:+ start:707 stop:1732 length:1026 start_codon:yes stop_codon:yes gene_type:complete